MIVQMRPRTTAGFPSTRSVELMLTNLIRLLAKNCRAVLAFERKCGLFIFRPLSHGNFCPDKISSKAINFVPSRRSE